MSKIGGDNFLTSMQCSANSQTSEVDFLLVCRDGVRKAKANLEFSLVRNVKGNKNGFYKYISRKRKIRENVGLLLDGAGDLVTKDMEKAKVFNAFFTSVFPDKTSLQL